MWTTDYSNLSEQELEQIQKNIGRNGEQLRVFIADIVPKPSLGSLPEGEMQLHSVNMEDRMYELENLVMTYGGVVILEHIQKRGIPDYNTYIGSGKLEEIMHEMQLQNANLLVLGNILKPHQIYKLNEKLKSIWAVAWDRVDLILKIFERNARTEETKLQIELAAIKHMWPRIFNMGMELGKQGGKGSGETNTEIMKRHLAKREKEIRKKLDNYSKVRENHRLWRKKKGFITVWIVWYTNAGKSTLLNALTNKWVLSEDKLFATLWTSVGKMWIAPESQSDGVYRKGTEILLSDTIWFIQNLPPQLIDAFASTLEDSIESDILLHIIDASDPKIHEKINVVHEILDSIWAEQTRILVMNKIDLLNTKDLDLLKKNFSEYNPIYISTHTREWLEEISQRILQEQNKLR